MMRHENYPTTKMNVEEVQHLLDRTEEAPIQI